MRILRALLVACALVAASVGCSGDGSTPPPPSTLKLTCGGYNTGFGGSGIDGVALALAAVIDPPPRTDVTLEVQQWDRRVTATCRAGERLCFPWFPAVIAPGGSDSKVRWDVGRGLEEVACTASFAPELPRPEGSAEIRAGKLHAKWNQVALASRYVATFRDLGPSGTWPQRELGRVVTTATEAEFVLPPGGVPELAVVDVEAWATDPDTFTGDVVPPGGADRSVQSIPVIGAPWSLKQPSDLASGALQLQVPAGSRLAVILLNLRGNDRARAQVRASGTGAAARPPPPTGTAARAASPASGRRSVPTAPPSLASTAATRTFCTFRDPPYWLLENQPSMRRQATLLLETAGVLLYVDDEDAAMLTAGDLDELARWWDRVAASATAHSGPLPDRDANGKFTLFFTSALGPRSWCFANVHDLWDGIETAPDCGIAATSYHSNGADMIHLHPPFGLEDDLGRPLPDEAQWAIVKGAMPYCLQHMVDSARFGRRYPGYYGAGEVKHARMSLAQTLAGSGNHVPALRALAAPALLTRAGLGGGWGGYPTLKLFLYDEFTLPHQEVHRAAADSFILFLADRLGPEFVKRFFDEVVGLRTLQATSGLPFPIAYALWTGALLFSNEPSSPWRGFDYLGEDWTPLHEKFMPFEYAPLESGDPVTATLRTNGFDAYVTGVAGPDGGTVTVTSNEEVKPYVVAIPFRGELP